MDRNSIIGLVLIVAILLGYGYFTAPSAEQIALQKQQQDSIASLSAKKEANTKVLETISPVITDSAAPVLATDSASQSIELAKLEGQFGAFAPVAQANEKEIRIETDKLILTLSNKGGRVKDVVLKDFKTYKGEPVQLFDPSSAIFGFNLTQNGKAKLSTQDLYFSTETAESNITLTGANTLNIKYVLATSTPGSSLELVYTIAGDNYAIDLQVNTLGLSKVISDKNLLLNWQIDALVKEKGLQLEQQHSSVYFKYKEEDRDYLSETSDDEEVLEQKTTWVAFKQQFFSAAIINNEGFLAENSELKIKKTEDSLHTKNYTANLSLAGNLDQGTNKLKLFFGPNTPEILKAYEVDQFDKIIDFGWGIFGLVNKYVIYYLYKFISSFVFNAGLAILLLTIFIKMALMPFTYKNYQSSAKMKILKPQVDAINEKFKNADPLKKQQEMLSLYKQTGVNPLAGCIPVIIQMPILYAMFRFFPSSIEFRQKSFLWADDLSAYDSIYDLGFNIPLYGDHISLFTILMCVSTFFYTRMNSANMPAPQQGMPDMRFIMSLFPFMMLFFFNNYGSGLSWYYFAANLVTIAQTWAIRKYFVDEQKILAKIESNKKKIGKGGKSNFQQKLEDMAKKRGVNLPK